MRPGSGMVRHKGSEGLVMCPTCGGKGRIAPETISFGMRVSLKRKELGLTQAELAPKCQIGRVQIANIEGDRSMPSVDVLVRLANVLGVSIDYLCGRP